MSSEDDVGVQCSAAATAASSVVRLADDLEPVRLEDRPGRAAEARVVVDDEDGLRHRTESWQTCGESRGTAARTLLALAVPCH